MYILVAKTSANSRKKYARKQIYNKNYAKFNRIYASYFTYFFIFVFMSSFSIGYFIYPNYILAFDCPLVAFWDCCFVLPTKP